MDADKKLKRKQAIKDAKNARKETSEMAEKDSKAETDAKIDKNPKATPTRDSFESFAFALQLHQVLGLPNNRAEFFTTNDQRARDARDLLGEKWDAVKLTGDVVPGNSSKDERRIENFATMTYLAVKEGGSVETDPASRSLFTNILSRQPEFLALMQSAHQTYVAVAAAADGLQPKLLTALLHGASRALQRAPDIFEGVAKRLEGMEGMEKMVQAISWRARRPGARRRLRSPLSRPRTWRMCFRLSCAVPSSCSGPA